MNTPERYLTKLLLYITDILTTSNLRLEIIVFLLMNWKLFAINTIRNYEKKIETWKEAVP